MGYLYLYPIIQLPHAAVTGLLLWAKRLGDIDSIVARPAPQQHMRAVSRCQLT